MNSSRGLAPRLGRALELRRLRNAGRRSARDLRMAYAGYYQRLLTGRSRLVPVMVAVSGVVDGASAVRRRIGVGHRLRSDLRLRALNRDEPTLLVQHAAVTGAGELSLTVRTSGGRPDGVRLLRADSGHTLDIVAVTHGEVTRMVAPCPREVWTGEPWHVAITVRGVEHRAVVGHRSAFEAHAHRAGDGGWPAQLEGRDDGSLLVRGRPPHVPGVEHSIRVGSVILSTDLTLGSPSPHELPSSAQLVFVHDETSATKTVQLEVDGSGHARADLDLRRLAGRRGRWRVLLADRDSKRPVQLPPDRYPALDHPIDPRYVRVPRKNGLVMSVEVGYGANNQLVVQVGRTERAAS